MESITHTQISDRDLSIKLQKDIFNMVTTDNFKLYDKYVNDLVTLDGDEGKILFDITEKRQKQEM